MSIKNPNCFYVYVYLDPRKPGKYKYGDYEFNYEPFYIGKGTGKRIRNHFKPSVLKDGTYKSNLFKKILSERLEPIGEKLIENLTDIHSKEKEIELIRTIGRIKLGTGPLTNLTDGGDGAQNFKHTEKSKAKIGKRYYPKGKDHLSYGKSSIEIFGEVPGFKGKKHTETSKRKIGDAQFGEKNYYYNKGYLLSGSNNPFYGKQHSKESLDKVIEYSWKFVSSDGIEYDVIYLKEFCEQHGLRIRGVYQALWKKNKGTYKCWKIEKSFKGGL